MFPPTVPLKSSSSRATPYSVTEVPRMGISLVAAAAACRAGVALARIRSTPLETKVLTMVAQVLESPWAFCSSNTTASSPSSSTMASLKPCVAASSASCCTSWQIPMVYCCAASSAYTPVVHMAATMAAERTAAIICFFIEITSSFVDFQKYVGIIPL